MFCSNCGNKLNEKATFCPSCGTKIVKEKEAKEEKKVEKQAEEVKVEPVVQQNNNNGKVVSEQDKKTSMTLTIISILCRYLGPVFCYALSLATERLNSAASSSIVGILEICFYLASYVLVIIAIVKNSKNTLAIVMLIIYIIGTVLSILFIIFAILLCGFAFTSLGFGY